MIDRFGEAARALRGEGERTQALVGRLDEAASAAVVWTDPAGDWTICDVVGHVEASHRGLLSAARGEARPAPGADLAVVNEERRRERAGRSLAHAAGDLAAARSEAVAFLETLSDADWARRVVSASGREWTVGELAWRMSIHERDHREQIEQTLGLASAGGRVVWLNVSAGGVPKLPIYRSNLRVDGLAGDGHRSRSHGGPTAALCLFSLEVIERLRAEGHPIYPGAVGENVTISGIDWTTVRPGTRLRIGPTRVEITRYTAPCANIAGAFRNGDFARILASQHPDEARVYASVLEEGPITVGDVVELIHLQ